MVVHEAMLRKRIVLATDVGGNSEIIEDGENWFSCSFCNAQTFK